MVSTVEWSEFEQRQFHHTFRRVKYCPWRYFSLSLRFLLEVQKCMICHGEMNISSGTDSANRFSCTEKKRKNCFFTKKHEISKNQSQKLIEVHEDNLNRMLGAVGFGIVSIIVLIHSHYQDCHFSEDVSDNRAANHTLESGGNLNRQSENKDTRVKHLVG